MKSSLVLWSALIATVCAQDLLFAEFSPGFHLTSSEWIRAQALNISTQLANATEWAAFTTNDFAKFKAIIIADTISEDRTLLTFLNDSKAVWTPATKGNVILIGTDPSNHCCVPGEGPQTLIDNAIQFAAAGTTPEGTFQTGLYMAMGYYYEQSSTPEDGYIEPLSEFGNFTMRGNLGCYNDVHTVASSSALGTLNDTTLSNWGCSIHEAFTEYPTTFQALAIAENVQGVGSKTFGDGTSGLPYIVSRGATPAGCGDGVWASELGEECDDGNIEDGDGCDKSCKCETGYLADGNGKCLPIPATTSSTTSTETSSTSSTTSTPAYQPPGYYPAAPPSYGHY